MALNPNIIIHEVALGNSFSGVIPTAGGSPVAQTDELRGRIAKFLACDDAGRINVPDVIGMKIQRFHYKGAGTTAAKLVIVDADGYEHLVFSYSGAAAEEFTDAPRHTALAPPGWHFKFTTTGVLTAAARLMLVVDGGWAPTTFHDLTYMGEGRV